MKQLVSIAFFLFFISILIFSGCGFVEGPKEKLNTSAFQFNEGLRWGRYNDVLPMVDAEALDTFKKIHAQWGSAVQISTAEILQVIYDENERKAIISVKFTWYRKSEMVVHDTITKQHWDHRGGTWWMVAEDFESGEPF